MWDQRFSEKPAAYGTGPNLFFKEQLERLQPGSLLLPGEGQGRNAFYAASLGWKVSAFDSSAVARQQCLKEADRLGLEIDYQLFGYESFSYSENSFDMIALIYTHIPSALREKVHQGYPSLLKKGGKLVAEFFSHQQLGRKSGGPQNLDMLMRPENFEHDFGALEIEQLEQMEIELAEGDLHQGVADVIRFVGNK